MGTRHLICVYYKRRFALAQYGQWDGYPQGQGRDIYHWIWKNHGNIIRLKRGLSHVRVLTTEAVRTQFSNALLPASLSRDTGSKIFELVACAKADEPVDVVLELDFVNDGLFCEWAYVLDLDDEVLEVWTGHVANAALLVLLVQRI